MQGSAEIRTFSDCKRGSGMQKSEREMGRKLGSGFWETEAKAGDFETAGAQRGNRDEEDTDGNG